MNAGERRFLITIEQKQDVVVNGDRTWAWVPVFVDVPAGFKSGPGREFLAAEAIRAETAGRFVMLYVAGVTADMRVLWDGLVWNIKAPPIVDHTARREMTLLVGAGVNGG
ncbi:MAG TPA: phage head closure protein [Lysobacter sp.]|jgi:SPP1 family predicted phage head-tail adaptor